MRPQAEAQLSSINRTDRIDDAVSNKRKAGFLLASLLILALLSWLLRTLDHPQPTVRFQITDLGVTGSTPLDLNNKGQVVGQRMVGALGRGGATAYVWDSTQGMLNLRLPVKGFSVAQSLNDDGKIAGTVFDENDVGHPFVWDKENGANLVSDLIGCGSSSTMLTHINVRGQLLGNVIGPDRKRHPFFWSQPTGMVRFSTPGSPYFQVCDLNNKGQVVGNLALEPDVIQPKVWSEKSGMEDFRIQDGMKGWVASINDEGVVFGGVMTPDRQRHFFEWTADAGLTIIGTMEDATEAVLVDVNTHGEAVGGWRVGFGRPAPPWWQMKGLEYLEKWFGLEIRERWAIYLEDGVLYDLNNLIDPNSGWLLLEAMAINDQGQVTGLGTKDGEDHVFLLTPIIQRNPENSTVY